MVMLVSCYAARLYNIKRKQVNIRYNICQPKNPLSQNHKQRLIKLLKESDDNYSRLQVYEV